MQNKKILIVKTSSLGDIIQCFPVLTYLKKKFPEAEIDWVVEASFAGLVESHPLVNRVYCVDTKKWRRTLFKAETRKEISQFSKNLPVYDVVFDLQGNIKSGLITWIASSPKKVGFGRASVAEWPNLLATNVRFNPPKGHNIREDYLFLVQSYFNDFTPVLSDVVALRGKECSMQFTKPTVMVCPGSAWPNKQLTPAALQQLLKRVQQEMKCSYVFIWGNDSEKNVAFDLQKQFGGYVPEKLSLPELQAMMRQMNLVISMDSLPLHLAGTTNTSTFSVFGPSSAEKYRPLGAENKSVQGPCPYGRTFEKRCPILRTCSTGACIHALDGDALFEKLIK